MRWLAHRSRKELPPPGGEGEGWGGGTNCNHRPNARTGLQQPKTACGELDGPRWEGTGGPPTLPPPPGGRGQLSNRPGALLFCRVAQQSAAERKGRAANWLAPRWEGRPS